MEKQSIDHFVKHMIRPEVRGLILQYALESPFKKDIFEISAARKHIIYTWIKCDNCYQLWRKNEHERNLNEIWSLLLVENQQGMIECFADNHITYEIDTRQR